MAQVFKTRIDPFVHKLSFIRIFSGTVKKDDSVHVSGARKAVKLHQLLKVQGSETQPIEQAAAGDIVAVAKVDELHTGLSLGEVTMPPIKFPTPMVGLAVTPKSRGDEGKLSGALQQDRGGRRHGAPAPRRADQGAGDERHERAASANHPRTA